MFTNMLRLSIAVIAIIFTPCLVTGDATLPDDVQRCRHEDTDCIVKTSTNLIRNYARKGYAAAALPILEPFHLKKVDVTDGRSGGSLNLKLTFRDIDVLGISTLNFNRAVGFTENPTTSKFEMYGDFQKLIIRGKYNADGRILILPIQGDGDAEIIFEKPKFSAKFKPSLQTKNGKTYLSFDKLKILIEPQRMTVKLANLFNGDAALGAHMNQFLNENWMDVWQELQPSVQATVTEILKSVLENVFKHFAYEDLFL